MSEAKERNDDPQHTVVIRWQTTEPPVTHAVLAITNLSKYAHMIAWNDALRRWAIAELNYGKFDNGKTGRYFISNYCKTGDIKKWLDVNA